MKPNHSIKAILCNIYIDSHIFACSLSDANASVDVLYDHPLHGRPDLKKDLKGMFEALNAVWEEAKRMS